jgi:hypothetical protein
MEDRVSFRGPLVFGLGLIASLSAGWLGAPRLTHRRLEQPLQFSHAVHTGEKGGMSCTDCHSLDAEGCFTGIPTTASCAACHSEALGSSAEEKRFIDQYVRTGREVPWLVYAEQPENAWFPHAPHVAKAKIACERCHGPHGGSGTLRPLERNRLSGYPRGVEGYSLVRLRPAEWEQGMKMSDCSNCHHQHRVTESCLTCHK